MKEREAGDPQKNKSPKSPKMQTFEIIIKRNDSFRSITVKIINKHFEKKFIIFGPFLRSVRGQKIEDISAIFTIFFYVFPNFKG